MNKRYDVAVIGTGPAGLSAAITLKIRNKDVLLIGSKKLSNKVEKAHEINNYLGLPAITGEQLADHFNKHLVQMDIEITEDKIIAVYSMGEYFGLAASDNKMYEATSVIIATGVNFGKPYPGEEKYLGRGVSYCTTCDALLYKKKTVAVIGFNKEAEKELEFLSEIVDKAYYIPIYKDDVQVPERTTLLKDVPLSIEGNTHAERLVLSNNNIEVDGIFILRDSVLPGQLVPGLEINDNHIVVDRNMQTNLKGCFACGDIVGIPYQYIKSAGEGNVAAVSAVNYLAGIKK